MSIIPFVRDARGRPFKLPSLQAYAATPVPVRTVKPDMAALSRNAAAALQKLIPASNSIGAHSSTQGGSCSSNG
jgi:hypothetical protein